MSHPDRSDTSDTFFLLLLFRGSDLQKQEKREKRMKSSTEKQQ